MEFYDIKTVIFVGSSIKIDKLLMCDLWYIIKSIIYVIYSKFSKE
jgi:hypothetical protein